jgi:hypothetical protein
MSKNLLRDEESPVNGAALHSRVALALVSQWQILRRWSPDRSFQELLANVLQGCAISVDHARAIVANFEEEVPTPKEIRDTAYSLRPKFESAQDEVSKWREQYGAPEPVRTDYSKPDETQEQVETKALIAAYGKEWARKASYPARYAALLELGFKLTPEIRKWYGEMIATQKQCLPPRNIATQ